MRTILTTLLLLLCLSLSGQEYKPSVTIPIIRDDSLPKPHPDKGWRGYDANIERWIRETNRPRNDVFRSDTILVIEKKKEEFSEVIVSLWDEYERECWNDSTLTGESMYYFSDSISNTRPFYHRNKPDPGKGFIEFIRKKYGI
jgi:hypothetical protein